MRNSPARSSVEREGRPERDAPARTSATPENPVLAARGLALDGLGNRALLSLLRAGPIQRKARVELARPAPLDGVRDLGGGQPLDTTVRAHFEPLLDRDLRGVRVHNDRQASDLAQDLDAVAVTVGQDIAFREGAFAPDTTEGRRLLGHELIHTVQQSSGSHSSPAAASRV